MRAFFAFFIVETSCFDHISNTHPNPVQKNQSENSLFSLIKGMLLKSKEFLSGIQFALITKISYKILSHHGKLLI